MRDFLRAFWRLRLKRRDESTRKVLLNNTSRSEVFKCDQLTGNPQYYGPKMGWRLLTHFEDTGNTAKREQIHDIELDEDILERIDFFACLFGTGRTW